MALQGTGTPVESSVGVVTTPFETRSRARTFLAAGLAAIVLALVPLVLDQYQAILLAYGLVLAIAALGFNLLLGYTGLLSFGHSAYFGMGAYAVALIVKYR